MATEEKLTSERMNELTAYFDKLKGVDRANFLAMIDLATSMPKYCDIIERCPDELMKRCLQTAVVIRLYAKLFDPSSK
jgi:hypothetical protein